MQRNYNSCDTRERFFNYDVILNISRCLNKAGMFVTLFARNSTLRPQSKQLATISETESSMTQWL